MSTLPHKFGIFLALTGSVAHCRGNRTRCGACGAQPDLQPVKQVGALVIYAATRAAARHRGESGIPSADAPAPAVGVRRSSLRRQRPGRR